MILELPVRWTEEDKETENLENILGDKADVKKKYSYGKLLIEAGDIGPYYDIDENHTMINDRLGKMYCVVIPISHFKKIITEVTGKAIMVIQVKEEDTSRSRRPRGGGIPPPSSEDDDMLR